MKVFEFSEDLRIKSGLRQYQKLRSSRPRANDQDLIKEVLIGRVLQTRAKEWGLRSIEDAEYALRKFEAPISSIEEALAWVIIKEDPKRYKLIYGDRISDSKVNGGDSNARIDQIRVRKDTLLARIGELKSKIVE